MKIAVAPCGAPCYLFHQTPPVSRTVSPCPEAPLGKLVNPRASNLARALRGAVRGLYQVELAWIWLRLVSLQMAASRLPPVTLLLFDDEAARLRLATWVRAQQPRWAAERRALDTLRALWSLTARVRLQRRLRWIARLERVERGPGAPVGPGAANASEDQK